MDKRALIVLLIISVVFNAFLFFKWKTSSYATSRDLEEAQKNYPLLSKRILQDFPQDLLINFLPLRNKIKEITASYGDSFGLYFEYLPTGTSIGINEKDEFVAASLFKLPVVMAYYHQKERLHKTDNPLVAIEPQHLDKRFGDLWKKGVGYRISLDDAVKIALTESDNTAARVVASHIDKEDFDDVYEGLDIDLRIKDEGAVLTTKHYASILKALYFSSVLSKENSQAILDMLAKTKFNDKLPAGLPKDVVVAHKIGVVDEQAYMDCGIVYPTRRTYLLCMISISDEDVARQRMRVISKAAYDYLVSVDH